MLETNNSRAENGNKGNWYSAASESLKKTLERVGLSDAYTKYVQRAAVFSDSFDSLSVNEIQIKEIVWHWLDRLYSPDSFADEEKPLKEPVYWMPLPETPVRTLFTSSIYGADSAAAEYFVNKSLNNDKINIAYCPVNGLSAASPCAKNFFNISLSKKIGYTKNIDRSKNDPETVGKFIIDQCFHLLFFLDSSKEDEDSIINRLFDYAISAHRGSIPHQIEVIYVNQPLPPMYELIVKRKESETDSEGNVEIILDEEISTVEQIEQFEQLSLF